MLPSKGTHNTGLHHVHQFHAIIDQPPNCTSLSNHYEVIDHGTSELDPTQVKLAEKNHMLSLLEVPHEYVDLSMPFLDQPLLAMFSLHVTNLSPNNIHPIARGV